MQFGKTVGTACSTFAITNIDAMFVLVTFFAEATNNRSITPLHITLGQYLGFTAIITVSMIGFAVAFVLPVEPIGFLGLLPILLGVWKGIGLLLTEKKREAVMERETEREVVERGRMRKLWESFKSGGTKNVFTVALVAIMNGGDNIGTYTPLFSQAKGAEIALYVVIYYILLGIWILIAWLIMKQKHILRVAEKWARFVVPFLYIGLGIYIVVDSKCYPWSVEKIDETVIARIGKVSMGVSTAVVMLTSIGAMVWFKWRKRSVYGAATFQEMGVMGDEENKYEQQTRSDTAEGGSNALLKSKNDARIKDHGTIVRR